MTLKKFILPAIVSLTIIGASDADARGGGGRGFSSGRSFRAPATRVVRPAPAPARPAPKEMPPAAKPAPANDGQSSSFWSSFIGGASGSILGGLFYDSVKDNESGAIKQPQNPCYPTADCLPKETRE